MENFNAVYIGVGAGLPSFMNIEGANPIILISAPEIKRNKWSNIEVNPETMETSKEFVYAGEDIVTGSATVIQAMGAGRTAANAIHKNLSKAK